MNLMKKILFTAIAAIALTFSAQAQKINYGLKVGVNLSTLDGIEVGKCDERTGFAAGVFAEIPFGNRFSIQPELLYNEKGGLQRFAETDVKGIIKHNLHYVSLPVAFKYRIVKGLAFEVGPELNYLAFGEEKLDLYANHQTIQDRSKVTDNLEQFDLAGIAGLSYTTKNGLSLGVRYSYGFMNVNKENNPGVTDLQNRNFQFLLGFRL